MGAFSLPIHNPQLLQPQFDSFCQIWEVPLRSNTAFTLVRTIETRWKTVKAISLSENIIATSYGGLIYVATNSDLPVKLVEAEYPHLENVDPETGESVQPVCILPDFWYLLTIYLYLLCSCS